MEQLQQNEKRSFAIYGQIFALAARPWEKPSFMRELFLGNFHWDYLTPYPEQPSEDAHTGDKLLDDLQSFLKTHIDPTRIDYERKLPANYLELIRQHGFLKLRMPKEEGGMGLSEVNYTRFIEMVGSWCTPLGYSFSVHNALAMEFIKYVQDDATRQRFYQLIKDGAVAGLANSEPYAAADPLLYTTANLSDDGEHYIINGEKVWIGNGPVAGVLVVGATTYKQVDGNLTAQINAFVVETNTPGFEVVSDCTYMGLKGLYNGFLRFTNVKVPKKNILGKPGDGLRILQQVVPQGRSFSPALCLGAAKLCLHWATAFSKEKFLVNQRLSAYQETQRKLSSIAANVFAVESMVMWAAHQLDRQKLDVRVELDVVKTTVSQLSWQVMDDTFQLIAGRAYETADSLHRRGAPAWPVERFFRDMRVHRIFGLTNEVININIIARSALEYYQQVLGAQGGAGGDLIEKLKFLSGAQPQDFEVRHLSATNQAHLVAISKQSKQLARACLESVLRHQAHIDNEQAVLGAISLIGSDLFAMAVSLARAEKMLAETSQEEDQAFLQNLVDHFCNMTQERIALNFERIGKGESGLVKPLSEELLEGQQLDWLLQGIITETPAANLG